MKRLILIAGIIITGLALSGCAKSNPAQVYHSYSFYKKHRSQAKVTYEACKKIPAFVKQNSRRFDVSKENKNCENAYYDIFGDYYHNFYNLP